MAYKPTLKLSKEDDRTHIRTLIALQKAAVPMGYNNAPAGKKNVPIAQTRAHLEPLLRHWPLFASTGTVPLIVARLYEETGIKYAPSAINVVIQEWELTPPNAHSQGAARPKPAARLACKR